MKLVAPLLTRAHANKRTHTHTPGMNFRATCIQPPGAAHRSSNAEILVLMTMIIDDNDNDDDDNDNGRRVSDHARHACACARVSASDDTPLSAPRDLLKKSYFLFNCTSLNAERAR